MKLNNECKQKTNNNNNLVFFIHFWCLSNFNCCIIAKISSKNFKLFFIWIFICIYEQFSTQMIVNYYIDLWEKTLWDFWLSIFSDFSIFHIVFIQVETKINFNINLKILFDNNQIENFDKFNNEQLTGYLLRFSLLFTIRFSQQTYLLMVNLQIYVANPFFSYNFHRYLWQSIHTKQGLKSRQSITLN